MSGDELVYSTDGSHAQVCPTCRRRPCVCPPAQAVDPRGTTLRLRLEKKGRGGKVVTVVYDLPANADYFEPLAKKLRSRLGTGGTYRGAQMEFQGDHRESVTAHLQRLGFTVKRSGG